jgi:hypothetical protein
MWIVRMHPPRFQAVFTFELPEMNLTFRQANRAKANHAEKKTQPIRPNQDPPQRSLHFLIASLFHGNWTQHISNPTFFPQIFFTLCRQPNQERSQQNGVTGR